MIEMLCRIPDHIGWMMVGATGALCAVMLVALGRTIYFAIKERLEDEECEDQFLAFSLCFFDAPPTTQRRVISIIPQPQQFVNRQFAQSLWPADSHFCATLPLAFGSRM